MTVGISEWELIGRLVLATVTGAAIGLERELSDHPAGLRTHALAALGSATLALVSMAIPGADPGRVSAQVVQAVGLLGAGVVIHERRQVHGLTTAMGLWTASGIGLAIGSGMYALGLTAAAMVILVLVLETVARIDDRILAWRAARRPGGAPPPP